MDDRFRNEEPNTSDKFYAPDSYTKKSSTLGDFSVNIDTKSASEPIAVPRTKRFEVHIPDTEDSYIGEPAPQMPSKPIGQPKKQTATGKPITKSSTGSVGRPVRTAGGTKNTVVKNNVKTAKQKKPVKKVTKKTARRYEIVKNLLISCVCIIFVSIIVASVSTIALGFINDILVISDDTDYSTIVEIPEGSDYQQVYKILCDSGLVRQPFLTDFFLKFRHYDTVSYQAGMYYLNSGDGIESMIESIMVKTNYAKDTVRLTFPEGWSIAQVFEKIEKYGVCEAEKLYANLDIIGKQYGFISDINAPSGRYLLCEGYLFPDTYDFFVGEAPSSVLKKLFNNFDVKWTDEYDERLKELGLTMDEVIIIASIIQREAKDGSQMKDISSVIYNRLGDPTNFPNIQMNSTSDYVTGLREYNLFSDTYYSIYLDSYNTYSAIGLPPGAICNPGLTAINAALYPSDTDYFFFCHDSSGNVYYAATAQEHAENTSKVLYGNVG